MRRQPAPEAIAPELSTERQQELVEAAVGRIETVDGTDFLDGYRLPPDDEGIFGGPKTYLIHVTHMYHRVNPRGQEEWAATEETHPAESTLTNAHARAANIGCIASGRTPLFILWEDLRLEEAMRHETLWNRFRKSAGQLVAKAITLR